MLQSAYISIISGASLWGLIALFFKFLTACGFSPLQIVALRVLFAAVLMTAVIFKIDRSLKIPVKVRPGIIPKNRYWKNWAALLLILLRKRIAAV